MGWLLVKFLGGDAPEPIRKVLSVRVEFLQGLPAAWLWGLGAVFLGISLLGLFPRSPARWRVRASLFALRLAGFGLLLLLVLQAVVRLDLRVAVRPRVAVLVDASHSMKIRDVNGQTRLAAVQGALTGGWGRALSARTRLSYHSFAGALGGIPRQALDGQSLAFDASKTDFGAALGSLGASLTGLDAAVLFSDGNDLGGSRPEAIGSAIRRRGLPVFTVGVGSAVRPREVRIRQVRTDEFVYLNDEITLSALVTGEGYEGQAKDVLLYEDGRLVQKAEVKLGERPAEIVFRYAPKQAGEHVYQVRVASEDEALGTEANLREVRVRVIDQKIRVLYVEGTPRFEFKLLRQALAEDPVVEYTSLLRVTSAYYMQGAATLKNPAGGFPRSEEELLSYDVVVLGSLSRAALVAQPPSAVDRGTQAGAPVPHDPEQGDSRLDGLANFVLARGGGLILLGGPESFGPGGFAGSPIEPLLPVRISVADKQHDERFALQVTPVGLLHPILRVAAGPKAIAAAWESVPQLDGCNELGAAKPTASLLATTPGEKRRPVMAVQQAGSGKVLAIAADSTWRWQMSRVTDENYYRRFWANAIRYVAPDPFERHGALRISASRSRYFVGDQAWVSTRLVDESYRPVPDAQVRFTVTGPDGARTVCDPKTTPTVPGRYDCRFPLPIEGAYRLKVERLGAEQEKNAVPPAGYTVVAERPADEMEGTCVDDGYLRALSEASGGAYAPLGEIEKLTAAMRLEPKAVERHLDLDLRNSLPFALLAVALLCLEWAIRKRRGLV